MKTALIIAVPGGMFATFVLWWLGEHLSPDAIGMAIGLSFGVLAIIPSMALVTLARRRDEEDFDDGSYIDVQPTYADQVTPYTHAFRRAVGLQPLLPRQNPDVVLRTYLDQMETPADTQAQISELEAYLDHLKALSNPQRDPRQFVVRWEGEAR